MIWLLLSFLLGAYLCGIPWHKHFHRCSWEASLLWPVVEVVVWVCDYEVEEEE